MTSRSSKPGFLVLGAKGKTGTRLVERLRRRDLPVRAVSRSTPERFDWDDEATWAPALEEIGAVYLIKSGGTDAAERLAAFCELAISRGATRLVFLSYRDAANEDQDHPDGERAVMESGGEWTILRPSWFAQNFSEGDFLRAAVLGGELVLPAGDGREPFIDVDDIAAVAASVLADGGHGGRSYDLSGPRLLSFGDAMEAIAKASGRKARYVAVDPEEFAAHAAGAGHSPGFIQVMTELCGWINEGRNAYLSDGVQTVVGRDPRDFREYVAAATRSGPWTTPARL